MQLFLGCNLVAVHSENQKFPPKLDVPDPGSWTFKSARVAGDFDRHVREQLPWYDLATGIVSHVARHYVPPGGRVYDCGASTGNVGRAIGPVLQQRSASLIAYDESQEMVDRYDAPGAAIRADIREADLSGADLIVAFLVMMFVPPADRAALISRMIQSLKPGGAILIFDKMAARGGHVGSVIYRLTLAAKYEAGALPEEIIRKELSLAGVQRPMTEDELPGFDQIFRFGDFAGYLYEAPAAKPFW